MKKILFITLIELVGIMLFVSCSNSPKKKESTPVTEPERPATLTVGSFKDTYKKGPAEPEGTLFYTDTKGKVSTVRLQDEGVTYTGFDTTQAGENKTITITYKGIDCVAMYKVVEPEKVDVNGAYIVGENTVLFFKTSDAGVLSIGKEVWKNWKVYSDLDYDAGNVTSTDNLPYTIDISSSGATVIRTDDWVYRPDGNGGIQTYKSEDEFFDPAKGYVPNTGKFYVSSTTAGRGTPDAIKNKYLVIAFSDAIATYQNMYMWFVDDTAPATLAALNKADAIVVDAAKFAFGQGGVELPKTEGLATEGKEYTKNLKVYAKDGYSDAKRAFSIVSYSDDNYKGYSYIMGLSEVDIPAGFWL